jgi:hypothetical protein
LNDVEGGIELLDVHYSLVHQNHQRPHHLGSVGRALKCSTMRRRLSMTTANRSQAIDLFAKRDDCEKSGVREYAAF